ncbi:acyl-CoA dehydrogenase family protein [Cryptosporangium aurantiacum]|uniref:Acyl-CoA dehydrogenase n=1 Tax=Cryptosporangium aurantiacum TaxID=134849 RepID=A0A1M7RBM2_9ACTN|nr:acyl-CoA dehydrogenase family protein [Cryptosporangium aurantiacum]SHN43687.1 hypothetical protein SAMN05443668_109304 [Cryptosporangium aurantiacum]
MRFALSAEQRAFAAALDALLGAADVPGAVRRWAGGDPADGLRLWGRLAELGVTGLRVPEACGGVGGTPVDLVVACERLGYHGVPGPYVESLAVAPALLTDTALLTDVAKGLSRISVAAPPHSPYALDADTATHVFIVTGRTVTRGRVSRPVDSVDPARRLSEVSAGEVVADVGLVRHDRALDAGALATASWLVGAGQRLLDDTVAYVSARRQFGRVIGGYQAVQHALADVRVGLDFARPLVLAAARAAATAETASGSLASEAERNRTVSAAKVLAAEAAHRAARTALQLHGAIGYTRELDLSLWILRVRALISAWGTPAYHRGRVLDALTGR